MLAPVHRDWAQRLSIKTISASLRKASAALPFSKRLLRIIWPFLAVVALLVALADISMDVLSSTRAFIGGESLWSSAHKDAVYHLSNYAVTHHEADYAKFKTAIIVPLGDRKARVELEKDEPNYQLVYQGFMEGGTHPNDIAGMTRLFRRFRHLSDIERAIAAWTEGDRHIAELIETGEALHRAVLAGKVNGDTLTSTLEHIHQLNDQLTRLEQAFSSALGEASRKAHFLLLVATLLTSAGLALLGIYLSRRMLRQSETYEQALRLSEERFRLAVTGSNDGLWDWNLESGEVYRSPRFKELLGYTDKELGNQRSVFLSLLHPEDKDAALASIDSHLVHNTQYDLECRLQTKSGEYRWFQLRGQAVRNSDGKAVRVAGAITDITERKRSEEAIRRLNADLEERVSQRTAQLNSTLKELESFSYSVSHDLRAPLRHIVAYSTILHDTSAEALSSTGRGHLDKISKSAKRMNDLIMDLLEFSQMGRAELRQRRISTDKLLADVLQEVRDSAPGRVIDWEIETLPDVFADQALLRQVWVNLLSNAVKYTSRRENTHIKIGYRSTETEWEFYVQDNGAGFDMQYADKLFGVFQRLHRADEFEGTGIGLANVRRIISRHGGRTWAEATIDEGAMFHFTLPREAS